MDIEYIYIYKYGIIWIYAGLCIYIIYVCSGIMRYEA